MDVNKVRKAIDNLAEVLEELIDEVELQPEKRYVKVRYISPGGEGSLHHKEYTYEDPWGDLKWGDVVARPTGKAVVVAVGVRKPQGVTAHLLVGRYRLEEL